MTSMRDEPIIKKGPSKGNWMQLNLIIFLLLIIGGFIAFSYKFISNMREDDFVLRSYEYTQVKTRTFVRRLIVPGSVQPSIWMNIEAKAPGLLTEVRVKPGEDVDQGQVIAILDLSQLEEKRKETEEAISREEDNINELSIDYEIEKRNNHKAMQALEKELNIARENLVLKEKLYELGSIPRKELNDARAAVDKIEYEVESKPEELKLLDDRYEVKLEIARRNLEKHKKEYVELLENLTDARVLSPISGRVLEVKADVGSNLTTGTTIAKLADMSSSIIVINFNEVDVHRISLHDEAKVTVGGETITGEVTYIAPQTTTVSGMGPVVEVHVSLNKSLQRVRANSTASVEFQLEQRDDVLYLPRGPYLTSGEYSFVYVRDKDKAIRRDVVFGVHDGNFIEIISGLSPGEEVIITSYEEFKENAQISIVPEGGRSR